MKTRPKAFAVIMKDNEEWVKEVAQEMGVTIVRTEEVHSNYIPNLGGIEHDVLLVVVDGEADNISEFVYQINYPF